MPSDRDRGCPDDGSGDSRALLRRRKRLTRLALAGAVSCATLAASWALALWIPLLDTVAAKALLAGLATYAAARIVFHAKER